MKTKTRRPRMVLSCCCADSEETMLREAKDLCALLNASIRRAIRGIESHSKHDIRGMIRFGFRTYNKKLPTCAGRGSLFRSGDLVCPYFYKGIPFCYRLKSNNDMAFIEIGIFIHDEKMPNDYSSEQEDKILLDLAEKIVQRSIRSITKDYTTEDDEALLRTAESVIRSFQRGKFYLKDLYSLCESYGVKDHDVVQRALTKMLKNGVVGAGENWSVIGTTANEFTEYEVADLRPEWQKYI